MADSDADVAIEQADAHHRAGRRADAEALCRLILERQPRHPGTLHLLARMAYAQNRLGPALRLARLATRAASSEPGYRNTLGIVLGDLRQWDGSVTAFAEAVRLDPACFEAHRNLGMALSRAGRADDAVTPLTRAAELRPLDPGAWTLLASLHHARLNLSAAIDCRRRALALRPDDPPAHSDLLATMHYSPSYSPDQLFAEHLAWAQRHEGPVLTRSSGRPFLNDPDAGRHLRVGYLSGDFHDHPISRFIFPLLTALGADGLGVLGEGLASYRPFASSTSG